MFARIASLVLLSVPLPAFAQTNQAKEKAVRRVLQGLTHVAAEQAAKPAVMRPTGDELMAELVRTAAELAMKEEESMRVPAFAVAIGLGLDDSTIVRSNPLTRRFCRTVESEEEFKARIPHVKLATVHGRRDLCQHFAVSCALADLVGPELARKAGLAKELQDMKGTSGFSFADLCLDYAGVDLIERLTAKPQSLANVRRDFTVKRFLPAIDGLVEGLTEKAFTDRFGSVNDDRFKAAVAEIEKRIKAMDGLGQ